MLILLNVIIKFLSLIICYRFFECFCNKKEIKEGWLLLLFSVITLFSVLINFKSLNNLSNLLVSFTLIVIISYLFTAKPERKVLVGILYAIFSIVIEVLIWFSITLFYNLDTIVIDEYNFYIYFGLILFQLIRYVLTSFIKRHKNHTLILENKFVHLYIMVIPLLSIILLFIFVNHELENALVDYGFCYFFVIAVTTINIFVFYIFEKTEILYQEKIAATTALEKAKYKEVYYENLEKHMEEIKIIKHDLKNQLISITADLKDTNYKRVEEAILLLASDITTSEQSIFTLNAGLNNLLNNKSQEFSANDIIYDFNINFPKETKISERDMISLIGNILDNAFEAELSVIDHRYINLTLCYYNNSVLIVCENRIGKKFENLNSSKKDSQSHGFGLKSIERTIKKYLGGKRISFTDTYFRIEINMWDM